MLKPIKLPQITNQFAKYDGRCKKYVLLNVLSDPTSKLTENQALEISRYQLLADLQTKWKQLQYQMPGNMNWLQSTAKYYRSALNLRNRQFTFRSVLVNPFNSHYNYWDSGLNKFRQQLKLSIQPVSPKGFEKFRTFVIELVRKQYKTEKEVKRAWTTIAEFISYQNTHYILAEHSYPTLIPPKKVKQNSLAISTNWVTEGKKLTKIINAVNAHWERTTKYSHDEVLGWLLYSGIIYGGINDTYLLANWLQTLTDGQARPFINERVYLSIRYKSGNYGNERVDDCSDIYNTKQVIVDLVSQCWLMRYNAQSNTGIAQYSQNQIKNYIFEVLLPILKPLSIELTTLSNLLVNASYYWEMLNKVAIDQASASILRGKLNHTGLMTTDFEEYLDRNYKHNSMSAQYELSEILKLKIESTNVISNTQEKYSTSKKTVRKSDLIQALAKDFKIHKNNKTRKLDYPSPTLIQKVQKRYKHYDTINERVIIKWTLSLLSQESLSNESIMHYVKNIGYEWLYFTEGQALQDWTSEDFEEMYDDIFEYKEFERKVTDLSYSARLFQRMHSFAVKDCNLAPVIIEQAKNKRRVRSELISPQAYYSIIGQVLRCVDILEREMFALLFILVYRTGMRKKELLGLRYIDIEGLSNNQPSLIVRPNKYRSTKTQGSIRRIAIFALLKPRELAFFINFVESNIGSNSNKFIFTLSSAYQPIDDHVPLQLLKKVLTDISVSDESCNFTFHAFRHTAVTNLSLVLNGRQDLIQALTDYNEDDVSRIKNGLLGVQIEGSDRWYALSGIMGHLSPKRSFEYYNHIATLMATYELSFAEICLPLKTVNNITGITNKKLAENAALVEGDQLVLTSIRKFLFKNTIKGIRKSPSFTIQKFDEQLLDYRLSTEKSDLFMRYGVNKLNLFLNGSDTLSSLKEAAHLAQINENDANILIRRAHQVSTLMTKHGRPRFVKIGESGKPFFSPLGMQDQSDFRMLSVLQSNAYKLRKISMNDWQWFIDTCSQRLTTTTSSVSFIKSKNDDLLRLIAIAKQLLPAKNWLITTNECLLTERLNKEAESIRIYYKESVTTIHIGILSPDIRANRGKWKYSPLLRFFVHMMIINDEQLKIK